MFKVMIIDPEIKSSNTLKKMLKNRLDVELLGVYSDTKKFLKEFVNKTTDVIFIWLSTNHYNGMHLGRAIRKSCPDIKIIFFFNNNYLGTDTFQIKSREYLFSSFSEGSINNTITSILKPITGKCLN